MKKLLVLIGVMFFICCSLACKPKPVPTTTPEEVGTLMDDADKKINSNPSQSSDDSDLL